MEATITTVRSARAARMASAPVIPVVVHPGYSHMRAAAAAYGWPEAFRDDLERHDRERLSGADVPDRFVWSIRATGTNLIDPRSNGDIAYAMLLLAGERFHHGVGGVRWHQVSREACQPISSHQVLDALLRERQQVSTAVGDLARGDIITSGERTAVIRDAGAVRHGRRDLVLAPWQGVDSYPAHADTYERVTSNAEAHLVRWEVCGYGRRVCPG